MDAAADFRSTVVFANPAAGGGRAARLWRELLRARPELEQAHVIFATDEVEARRQLDAVLVESAAQRVERVLSVGGDGTLHLVVNELLRTGRARDVALGLIPAGTGSDLARFLDLPKKPHEALAHVLRAVPRRIDLLRITAEDGSGTDGSGKLVEHAINTTSAGLSGLVCGAVNAQPRRGPDVFLRATLGALFRFGPLPCRIEVEGPETSPGTWYDGDLLLLAMANGRYFGNGMKIAPHAELDDGLMDVVLVPSIPRWKLPFYLPRLYLGTHLAVPSVRFARASKVRLQPKTPFPPLEVDGEAVLTGDVEIEVLPGALLLLS